MSLGQSPKILVVDDRPENLIAMRAALDGLGYTLVEALSGAEALDESQKHDFAVVLLDVQMPGLDGFETAQMLRAQSKSESTPIIFVTAIHQTETHEYKGYISGAVDYLFKPVNVEILKAKVSVFVEMQRKTELLRKAAVRERELAMVREALAAQDEFLSVVSHELKSPLTPLTLHLQTFIELFQTNTLDKIPPEKMLKMLMTSQHQVQRLTHLVNELVDVARIRHGNLELNLNPVNLSDLVQSVCASVEKELSASGCEVKIEVDKRIFGSWDRFRIEQVLVNLIENACKFGQGKPIEIMGHLEEDDQVVIKVRDYGIGIAEQDLERIFDRFERANSAKNFGGLGLGLYISKQIVNLHGGILTAESEIQKGSTFSVRLPTTVSSNQ